MTREETLLRNRKKPKFFVLNVAIRDCVNTPPPKKKKN